MVSVPKADARASSSRGIASYFVTLNGRRTKDVYRPAIYLQLVVNISTLLQKYCMLSIEKFKQYF